MPHHCHARRCTRNVKPEYLMCVFHWRMVPQLLQRAVWRAYRPGQCDDKRPSISWMAAADAAIEYVAQQEGYTKMSNLPSLPPLPLLIGVGTQSDPVCKACGYVLTPEMRSQLQGGEWKHINCPQQPPASTVGMWTGGPPMTMDVRPAQVIADMAAVAAKLPALPTLPALGPLSLPLPTSFPQAPALALGGLPELPTLSTLEAKPLYAVPSAPSSTGMLAIREPTRILCADPPWEFADKLPGEGRGAEKHYKVLTLEDIKAFPLPPLQDDAVLFMWRVSAMVEEAYAVVRAWGFTPKSEITWRKTRICGKCKAGGDRSLCEHCQGRGYVVVMGMGRYTRHATETCIIACRGKLANCKPKAHDVLDVFDAHRAEHSEKPDRFYQIVEKLYPQGPYAELFARKRRAGWSCYGDELPPE